MASAPAMASALPRLPVFEAISRHRPDSTSVVHSQSGRRFTYGELLGDVCKTRNRLYQTAGTRDLNGERVAFLVENSYDYVVTLLAILAAKSIAVPLSAAFTAPEFEYMLNHSEALLLVSSSKFSGKADEALETKLNKRPHFLRLEKFVGNGVHETVKLDDADADAGAAGMMLYTSGTTDRPKGVLLPQSVMTAQARCLVRAWEYAPSDRLLHVLPLHHIHGIINAIFTPLFSGSSIEFLYPFIPDPVWRRFAAPFMMADQERGEQGASRPDKITFFTGVPEIYKRLLKPFSDLPADVQRAARTGISPANLRLAISGSAPLPTTVQRPWTELSRGNLLLERYGMTEVGMALSCGLETCDRIDGSVGWPLPGVEARLVDVETNEVICDRDMDCERSGELQLRGPTVFAGYWANAEATAREFVDADDGRGPWFRTRDVAMRRRVQGVGVGRSARASQKDWARGDSVYFILGRLSVDIIKSGGEKVSALEVEREMRALPQVAEVAVVAVPSGQWGQKVGAVVMLNPGHAPWTPLDMRKALRGVLAAYKIPQVLRVVDRIPLNAMGKVNKKELVKAVFQDDFSGDEGVCYVGSGTGTGTR